MLFLTVVSVTNVGLYRKTKRTIIFHIFNRDVGLVVLGLSLLTAIWFAVAFAIAKVFFLSMFYSIAIFLAFALGAVTSKIITLTWHWLLTTAAIFGALVAINPSLRALAGAAGTVSSGSTASQPFWRRKTSLHFERKIGDHNMRKAVAICAITGICSMAALLSTDTASLAQAGSTGGTLGKTGKSASGGEEPHGDKKAGGRGVATKQAGNGCSRVAGRWQWKWLNNTDSVTLNANGTGTGRAGMPSTWTCTGRTVIVDWKSSTNTLVLSSDGNKLVGTSSFGGIAVVGTRQ